jgi:NitT/TauT family transport system ATP-binding protein
MTAIATATINAKKVSKAFDDNLVVDEVSFTVRAGEFVSIVGPSGCGKSTILRMIAGLEDPTSGTLALNQEANENDLSFVFQDPTLLPWRNVYSNVALPLELRRTLTSEDRESIDDAIRRVGLTKFDKPKLPHMLSGGMRMRVSIARALVTRPRLLLLDEPFAAVDDVLRQQLNEELLKLWQQSAFSAVFVTHNIAEAVFLSQRILVMGANPGRLLADIKVPFDFPRDSSIRTNPEFAQLAADVLKQLRGS